MADACSLSKEGLMDCGSSRGRTETMFLYEYRDDVTTHPKDCFFVACKPERIQKKKHDRTENAWTVSTSRCPIQSLRKLF